ncbi:MULTISPECIES: fasciclin domain-containing protein [unclassified Cryobacterium]|uniref:fasciclin domain-containing protein n=1 Tax=unclassified Cryobacterium TaxID=2649013 RepID=UPI002AB39F08|nr:MULTISPECIES: fasciclin domain-containing protein [unclassified Cryobacterium]MDY7528407.1 fasciclin domain-containing protein [Cryobacterium sp. 10C2]MDY7540827.1 fasciclin domain-containing protein [Cryobacterium sp. 5B3]MDY7555846.1 fasciclin domain-containing protein [Cryobacterium sp. 10C3]MEB0000225.1 fasciclin domain-containing protein [Cryobacterium sp. RTS3]MEB0202741.1 fasciclin domain-containing protein [Cryobacterium sp. 5I3]
MLSKTGKTLTIISLAAAAALGLSACASTTTSAPAPTQSAMASPSNDSAAMLVGTGCAAYAKEVPTGPGSVTGMSTSPVTVAASNNPLLKTLTAAVSGSLNPAVNLAKTLDGAQYTIFAPVDSAFAKIDAATLATLKTPAGAATLTSILTYHVVPGQLAPDMIAGPHATVNGASLTVTGSGDTLKVNGASVICGGVQTKNATVYLIDTVLMPPTK